jgi:hypothetical protein
MWIFARSPQGRPLVLRSADGVGWTSEPLQTSAGTPVQVLAAVTLHGRLVVIGTTTKGIVRLVPAAAGRWEDAAVTGLPGTDVAAIQLASDSLVAFGGAFGGPNELWVSADGVAWRPLPRPVPGDAEATFFGIAVHGDRAVIIGHAKLPASSGIDTADTASAAWTATSANLAP